jgi:hypothetical protein
MKPFQYQIGSVVFGRDTDIVVKNISIQPYNVNNQDFQLARSDEVRFGIDTLAPSTIIFELSVLNNYAIENMEELTGESISDSLLGQSRSLLSSFAEEWKSVATRRSWGAMVPLQFCDGDGIVREIYGRPGKFTHAASKRGQQWIDVQAEFRRADTYAYGADEKAIELYRGDNPSWFDQDGDAPAWFRVLFYGPIDYPAITVGGQQIYLDMSIAAGDIVEVSSYPWSRRIVDSDGVNHRTKLRGVTQYLDELRIYPQDKTPIRWTDANIGLATWCEIESTKWEPNPWFGGPIKIPWDTYKRVRGQKAFWHGKKDTGGFLSAQLGRAEIIDQVHAFQTANQFAQVSICAGDKFFLKDEIPDGKTTVLIMANDDLTQYLGLELEKNNRAFAVDPPTWRKPDYIRIVNQNGVIQSLELPVGGLAGGDTVSIMTNSSTKTVDVKHNGEDVMTWADWQQPYKLNWDNVRQGFIVNGSSLIGRDGCRINNLVAHDISLSLLPQTGRCVLIWRDAYNVI